MASGSLTLEELTRKSPTYFVFKSENWQDLKMGRLFGGRVEVGNRYGVVPLAATPFVFWANSVEKSV